MIVYRILAIMTVHLLLFAQETKAQSQPLGLDLDSSYRVLLTDQYQRNSLPFEQGTIYRAEGIQTSKNHQFYKTSAWTEGCLTFEQRRFCGLKLLYNTLEEVLVVQNLKMNVAGVKSMLVNQSKVQDFSIHDETFIHHLLLQDPPMKQGFYRVVYKGEDLGFYGKYRKRKEIYKNTVSYPSTDRFYLYYQDAFIPFAGKRSIYSIVPTKKQEVKKLISEYSPKLSRKRTEGIGALLSEVEKLLE